LMIERNINHVSLGRLKKCVLFFFSCLFMGSTYVCQLPFEEVFPRKFLIFLSVSCLWVSGVPFAREKWGKRGQWLVVGWSLTKG
jgi:hypothetical protein